MFRHPRFRKLPFAKNCSVFLAVLLCCALVMSTLFVARRAAAAGAREHAPAGPPNNGQGQGQRGGQGRGPRPIEGPPGVGLPNTDELLRRPRHTAPIIRPSASSRSS